MNSKITISAQFVVIRMIREHQQSKQMQLSSWWEDVTSVIVNGNNKPRFPTQKEAKGGVNGEALG